MIMSMMLRSFIFLVWDIRKDHSLCAKAKRDLLKPMTRRRYIIQDQTYIQAKCRRCNNESEK